MFSMLTCCRTYHIGLGRYGDPLDPEGTIKAINELKRVLVLAVGGNLYFSLPVGSPRLCFNAHRIHSPGQILEYFSDLKLVEFSGVDDKGNFLENIILILLNWQIKTMHAVCFGLGKNR